MRVLNYLLAFSGLIPASFACAEMTLTEAQHQAYALDPTLQYLYRLNSSNALRLQYSGRLNNPEIAVELDNLGNSDLKDLDGPSYAVQLSQAVPLNNKRSLRVELATAQQNSNQLAIQQRQAQLNADTRLCLAEWSMAEQRQQLAVEDHEIAQSQAHLVQEKYRAGRVVQSDAQRAQALAIEAQQKLELWRSEVQQRQATCTLLAGDLGQAPIQLSAQLPLHSADSAEKTLSQRHALLVQQQAAIQQRLAHAERLPDITLSVGTRRYQQTGDQVLLAGAAVPLPFFDQNQVARADAKNQLEQASYLVEVQHQRSVIQLNNAKQRLQSNQQLLATLDQTVIPAAQESLRIAQLAYQSGKTGLLEWIEARRVWRESRERRLEVWLNMQQAIADIEREIPSTAALLTNPVSGQPS